MKHIKIFEKFEEKSFKNKHGETFSLKIEYGNVYIKGNDINTEYSKLEDVLKNTIFNKNELDVIEKFLKNTKNKIPTNKYKIYQDAFEKTYRPKYIKEENPNVAKREEGPKYPTNEELTEKFKFLIGKKLIAHNSETEKESPVHCFWITSKDLSFTPSDVRVICNNGDNLLFVYVPKENTQGTVEGLGKYKGYLTKSKEYGCVMTSYIAYNILNKVDIDKHFDVLVYDIPIDEAIKEFFKKR